MKIAILTTQAHPFAAFCLQCLRRAGIPVALVVNAGRGRASFKKQLLRKVKKTWKVGILGVANGVRMRAWYDSETFSKLGSTDLGEVAAATGVRVATVSVMNAPETRQILMEEGIDLALSLGNGLLAPSVFTAPTRGTLNIHHEELPEFQGAASVIWQIYRDTGRTGYSIHEVDRGLDTGRILLRASFPIEFRPTLRETVALNHARLLEASVDGLVEVLHTLEIGPMEGQAQTKGRTYTTPTIWEFLRMLRNHRRAWTRQKRLAGG